MEEKRKLFWRSFIGNITNEIKQKFLRGPKPFQNADNKIFANILSTLVVFMDTYLLPVVVDYINQQKSNNTFPTNGSIYDALFSKSFEEIVSIFETNYSEVMIKIYGRVRLFTTHYIQTCDRIFADWEEIKNKFNISDEDQIHYVRFFCGDAHGAGAQTTMITFNGEKKGFVYKPVDLSIVEFFHEMIKFTEEECGFKFKKIPSIILKQCIGTNNYGYINFIPYQGQVKNRLEAEAVYENFGHLLAFARFFKVSDGHCDNVIIQSPNVFWIDLENAFHLVAPELITANVNPLEITGLLVESKAENTVFGIITGIQGGTLIRLNLTQPIAYNEGTDDMYIRYFGITDVAKDDKKNRIYLNGELCMPEDYIDSIKKGYSEVIELLIKEKQIILNFINNYFRKNKVNVRHIFKATACYARYINMINHVIAVKKGDVLSQIRVELDELTQEKEPFKRFVIENEIIDMCNGVIPYFYRSSFNNTLYHSSGCFIENFFMDNMSLDFTKHLANLSIENVPEDLSFIEKSLKSTAGIKTWEDFKNKFEYPEFDYENVFKLAAGA